MVCEGYVVITCEVKVVWESEMDMLLLLLPSAGSGTK